MTKKKILLVSDVKNWGGWVRGEYIIKYLSDEFSFDLMDGEEFGRYAFDTDNDVFNQENFDSFKHNSFDKEAVNINDFINHYKASKIKDEYDLIYLMFHTMLLRKDVTRLLKKARKIITIVTAYPTLRAGYAHGNQKEREELFLERANKCVAVGANNVKSLNDLKSIYNSKTFYACRGVDPKKFYPTKKEFVEKTQEAFTVAFCGKEGAEKGYEDIIKPACQRAGVKLVENLRNYTNALNIRQMRDFYNNADAYIVASVMDGTPNTALEAAACGKPIISNKIGNMPELIEDNKNGYIVDRKVEAYIHKLAWMKRNQKETWEVGQKGRETVLNNWNWKKVLNENERNIFREFTK